VPCIIRQKCFYAQIFEADQESRSARVPPYVIDIAAVGGEGSGETEGADLSFDILLFGTSLANFEFFLLVFSEMGRQGIGKQRIKSRRVEIKGADGRLIYSSEQDKIINAPVSSTFIFSTVEPVERVRVSYRSPLRLLKNGRLIEVPDFESLIRSALRRFIYLMNLNNQSVSLPTSELVAQSAQVQTVSSTLQWVNQVRTSNRSKLKMNLGGMIGAQEFVGRILPLHLDLLNFAAIFHLGKNSTFGLGKLDIFPTSR